MRVNLALVSFVAIILLTAVVAFSDGGATELGYIEGIDSVPGDDCPAGEIHDDGTVDNGYSYNAGFGITEAILVDKFTPGSYPWEYNNVCVCITQTGGDTEIAYNVVVYDDDGAGGAPGTLLATFADTAAGVPTWPTTEFYGTDISTVAPAVAAGSVYIGVSWDPEAELGFFFCVDESVGTPINGGYTYNNSDDVWNTTETIWAGYRSMLIRSDGVFVPVELQTFSVE